MVEVVSSGKDVEVKIWRRSRRRSWRRMRRGRKRRRRRVPGRAVWARSLGVGGEEGGGGGAVGALGGNILCIGIQTFQLLGEVVFQQHQPGAAVSRSFPPSALAIVTPRAGNIRRIHLGCCLKNIFIGIVTGFFSFQFCVDSW